MDDIKVNSRELYDELQRIRASVTRIEVLLVESERRINRIENDQSWLWRTLLGTIIAVVAQFFISK